MKIKHLLGKLKDLLLKIKIKPKKIIAISYWLVILIVLFVVVGTAVSVYNAPAGFRMLVVTGGSMEPAIKTGSVVLTFKKADYSENDIVSFLRNPSDSKRKIDTPITHRIVGKTVEKIENEEERITFTTKGDANKTPDLEVIRQEQILGKVLLSIPVIGNLLVFSQTQLGFTLLVVVPVILIIYTEIQKIIKQVSNKEDAKKKVSSEESKEEKEKAIKADVEPPVEVAKPKRGRPRKVPKEEKNEET